MNNERCTDKNHYRYIIQEIKKNIHFISILILKPFLFFIENIR